MDRANGALGVKSPLACAVMMLLALALCAVFSASSAYAIAGIDANGNVVKPEPNLPSDWYLVTLDDVVGGQPVGDLPGASQGSKRGRFGIQAVQETKEMPLLMIVVGFSDVAYSDDWDWSTAIFDSSEGARSISSFYSDMSLGQFTFAPAKETSVSGARGNTNKHDSIDDGIVHVTLDAAHEDWSDLQSSESNLTLAKMLSAAVNKADEVVDFSAYDADGSESITTDELAIGFVIAGYEAAFQSSSSSYSGTSMLWSHAWSLDSAFRFGGQPSSALPCPDGVTVQNYIAIAENLTGEQREPLGTLAHELGHYLGLPDMYDTSYKDTNAWSGYSVNYASVMSNGSWGYSLTREEYQPVAMDAACRETLGWITPTVATGELVYEIGAQDYSGSGNEGYSVLKVPTDVEGEYFLIENRQHEKWDEGLDVYQPADGGLIIWHVDRNVAKRYSSTVNNGNHRPAFMPLFPEEDADGNVTLIGNTPDSWRPFFSADIWESDYRASLGESAFLPIYGSSSYTASPSTRTLSDLKLTFKDSSSSSMHVAFGCGHDLVHHEAVAPSCTEGGNLEYWECAKCARLYADEAAEKEVSTEGIALAALDHAIVHHAAVEAECTEPGMREYWECSRCGEKFEDSKGEFPVIDSLEVEPLGHLLVHKDLVEATCTSTGTRECWECSRCQEHFQDEYASYELPEDRVVIRVKPHDSNGPHVEAVAATCTEPGSIEHWTCSMCGRLFADEAATQEVGEDDLAVPALGHKWDSGTETKAATATDEGEMTYVCTVCGEVKVEELPKVVLDDDDDDGGDGEQGNGGGSGTGSDSDSGSDDGAADDSGDSADTMPDVDDSGGDSVDESSAGSKTGGGKGAAASLGADGTAYGAGASLAAVNKAITARKSDADPKGTVYAALKARATKTAKTSITLSWSKPAKAKKYVVYGAACGKSNKMKKLATVKKATVKIKKISGKALSKGRYYKFMVIALNGSSKVVSSSKIVHASTTGGKVTNVKSVTTAASKGKVTLKTGKTFALKAKQKKASKKLALKTHRKLSYESSNTKVATVTSAGKIKAKAAGTCYVYAYAQNGAFKRVKVTVKPKAKTQAKTASTLQAAAI